MEDEKKCYMIRYLKLYSLFLKQNIKVVLEYRIDFLVGLFSTILEQIIGVLFIWILFKNISNINGWNYYEIVFIYSIFSVIVGIDHIFFENLWFLGDNYIRNGKFDNILVRPVNPLFHIIADKVQQDGIGKCFVAIYLFIYSYNKLHLSFGMVDYLMLIVFVISGSIIFIGINIAISTSAFYIVNNVALMWAIFQFNEFASYPITIFNKYIRFFISWIIPYAFTSYYPAIYFLNKGYKNISFLAPVVAIFILFCSIKIWNIGLKKYNSAGG